MLRYSDRALSTRSIFYGHYNDITIIVEDFGDENFYTRLFQHLFGDALRIGRVIGVGGKTQVIQRFESRNNRSNAIEEFYVVDGDFDEILGHVVPTHERFYRLPRYDVESFLIEEAAICYLAEEQGPKQNPDWYKEAIIFSEWKRELANSIARLIACFVLCQECSIIDHGSQNVGRFMSGNRTIPDSSIINNYIVDVRTQQSYIDDTEFDRRLELMLDRMGDSEAELFRWISGKHILLPLVGRILQAQTGRNVAQESLRFRLIRYCQLDGLSELRQKVLALFTTPGIAGS